MIGIWERACDTDTFNAARERAGKGRGAGGKGSDVWSTRANGSPWGRKRTTTTTTTETTLTRTGCHVLCRAQWQLKPHQRGAGQGVAGEYSVLLLALGQHTHTHTQRGKNVSNSERALKVAGRHRGASIKMLAPCSKKDLTFDTAATQLCKSAEQLAPVCPRHPTPTHSPSPLASSFSVYLLCK